MCAGQTSPPSPPMMTPWDLPTPASIASHARGSCTLVGWPLKAPSSSPTHIHLLALGQMADNKNMGFKTSERHHGHP
jgi:hypothetical protein